MSCAQGASGGVLKLMSLVAAGLAAPFVARASRLEIGAGLLYATLAAALHIIPPLIPPGSDMEQCDRF